ncbi:MAG: hypothetical protein GQ570_13760 [Helicobacteraceae bacterium]|nr:hypothetical protein [Helicobacteraceae bacterium]
MTRDKKIYFRVDELEFKRYQSLKVGINASDLFRTIAMNINDPKVKDLIEFLKLKEQQKNPTPKISSRNVCKKVSYFKDKYDDD